MIYERICNVFQILNLNRDITMTISQVTCDGLLWKQDAAQILISTCGDARIYPSTLPMPAGSFCIFAEIREMKNWRKKKLF